MPINQFEAVDAQLMNSRLGVLAALGNLEVSFFANEVVKDAKGIAGMASAAKDAGAAVSARNPKSPLRITTPSSTPLQTPPRTISVPSAPMQSTWTVRCKG